MPGRNDPCPCGSGKKYKKCHLQAEEARTPRVSPLHAVDERVTGHLLAFAKGRADIKEWKDHFAPLEWVEEEAIPSLLVSLLYEKPVGGRTVIDWFVQERGRRLSEDERRWVEAQQRAWTSVWEVLRVEPGRGFTLHDLLTGQSREVHETLASRIVVGARRWSFSFSSSSPSIRRPSTSRASLWRARRRDITARSRFYTPRTAARFSALDRICRRVHALPCSMASWPSG